MSQFTVYRNRNSKSKTDIPYLLDVQSDLLSELGTRVVIPLFEKKSLGIKPLTKLTPEFQVDGKKCIRGIPLAPVATICRILNLEESPKTLAELEREFATERRVRTIFFQLRWPEGFVCPRCGGTQYWTTKRALFNCARCQYQMSVKAGTIFAGSRSSLVTWFRAIWWVTSQKNGASAKGLQRILGLGSYKTAWTWLHKLRRAMVRPGRDRLAGVVEVDEIYIGGEKPGKRGRGAAGKALVLIAAQVDGERIGRIRLRRVKDASGASLEPAIQEDWNRVASFGPTVGWVQ